MNNPATCKLWVSCDLGHNLSTNTAVLGNYLNKLVPDRHGKINSALVDNSSHSRINSTGSDPLGNRRNQNRAESNWGIIRVPEAFVFSACLITLGTKHTGGNYQLFSISQLQVNTSTVTKPGVQNLELTV